MNFLAPQFLFGLLAISIPIIIHLFNFRKIKKVYFSSNRHLRKIAEETSSKKNLKHLLILLARTLFISFLVLAFAQPYFPAEEEELQSYVQIYLDNSNSMSNEVDEDLTALDEGILRVNEIIDQYPSTTRFKLLTNDFESFSNIFRSGEEIKEITTELNYSKISRQSNQIRERLKAESVSDQQMDSYWISDFQSSMYTEPIRDSMRSVRLLPLFFSSRTNIYIDSLYTDSPFLSRDDRTKLYARLVNKGEQEVENLNLKVFINDNQVTTNSISLPPNSNVLAEFDVTFGIEPFNRGRISFEDFPVTFDNEFYFVLSKNRKLKVIEIQGANGNQNIGQVYANSDLFDYINFPVSNINYNEIGSADAVILNGLASLDNSLSLLLDSYLRAHGTLCIIPAVGMDTGGLSQLIGGIPLQTVDSSAMIEMSSPDFNNPFFEGVFEEKNTAMKMPSGSEAYYWFDDRNAILKLQNGRPFLSKISREGTVYLFASPFESKYTNFPFHALFVPVMYKIAMSGPTGSTNLYHSLTSQQLILPLDSVLTGELLRLSNSEKEIVPQQRISGSDAILELPPMEIAPGFYQVMLNNEVVNLLAFNYDKTESDLNQLSTEEIGFRFLGSDYEIFSNSSGDAQGKVLFARYQPVQLWKYALLLAMMFLALEILLFKFMP